MIKLFLAVVLIITATLPALEPSLGRSLKLLYVRVAQSAAAFVEVQANIGCVGASTCNNSITMTAGNANIVFVTWKDSVTLRTISSVADGDVTYTLGCTGGGLLAGNISLWYREDSTAGAKSVTATLSGVADTVFTLTNTELSGFALTSALDKCDLTATAVAPGTGTDAIVSASVTTDSNGQFIFGGLANNSAAASGNTAGTGYTRRSGTTAVRSTEDLVQGAAGAITATYTTNRGTDTYLIGVATFREPSAAAGTNQGMTLRGAGQ